MNRNLSLALFRHFWYVVALGALLGVVAGWGVSQLATREYTSTTSLYFSLSAGVTGNDINQGSTYTQNQMLSFAQLATSSVVLQPVIDGLGLEQTVAALGTQIAVTTPQNTVVLQLDVTDTSAKNATAIANATAASLRRTSPRRMLKESPLSLRASSNPQWSPQGHRRPTYV